MKTVAVHNKGGGASPTMTFDYCGVTLASNIGLPELRRSSGGSAGITFVIVPGQPPEAGREPLQYWDLPDSTPWLTMRRDLDGYLLHFEGLATFRVTRDGRHVCCWPEPGTPGDTVRHLFLNQTMPLVFSLMARAVFHASAVQVGEGAIAFSGATGQGKSTLAGSFVQAGASLLTDDCLLLDDAYHVVPSYPGVRLWPDVASAIAGQPAALPRVCHYSCKRLLGGTLRFASRPVPLRRLYLMANPADDISIAPLTARDALIELVRCSFVLDVADPVGLKLRFETLCRLAAQGLVFRLSYPHNLARLPELRGAILRHGAEG